MALKNSYTTADALDWSEMLSLVYKTYRDGDYRMSLLIATQSMWGLRIGDLLKLRWKQILDVEELIISEEKTGKRRVIKMNNNLQKHIQDCHKSLNSPDVEEPIFLSRQHTIYSREWVNVKLKSYKAKYHLNIKNYTSHAHRKTFGRHIVEMAGENAEKALIKLSEIFSHSSIQITRKYLGLRQTELSEVYTSLDF